MKSLSPFASYGLFSLLCLAALPGCLAGGAQQEDAEQLAKDTAALTGTGSQSSGLGEVVLSPVAPEDMMAATADVAAAQAVETKPITGLFPEGCAVKTRTD